MKWGCYEKMTLEKQFSASVSRLVRMGWDSRRDSQKDNDCVSTGERRLMLSEGSEQHGGGIDIAVHHLMRSI